MFARHDEQARRTLFFVSFLARLSFEFLINSITRFSYGAKPATSRMTERTNFVLFDWIPLRCEGLTVLGMAVVGCPLLRPLIKSDEA